MVTIVWKTREFREVSGRNVVLECCLLLMLTTNLGLGQCLVDCCLFKDLLLIESLCSNVFR